MAITHPQPTRVRGVAELIATLPYQLGYQPERSLVVMLLRSHSGGRPATAVPICTVRVDLTDDPADLADLRRRLEQLVRRERPDLVQLMAFEDTTDATAVLTTIATDCDGFGVLVASAVRVRDGRWLELRPHDGSTPRWRQVPSPDRVPASADFVLRGATRGGDRDELSRRLDDPRPLSQQAVLQAWLASLAVPQDVVEDVWSAGARVWGKLLQGPRRQEQLSVEELCALVDSLDEREFRDALLAWLCPGQLGPGVFPLALMRELVCHLPVARSRLPWLIDDLVEVCRRLPAPLTAPVLTVLAQVAWWEGNGSVANIAVARALTVDPTYPLAQLLDEVLARAIPPASAGRVVLAEEDG